MYSKIIGTGSYLPANVVTNADLEKVMDTTDQWIRDRTGISERRVAAADETSADMGVIAAQRAMQAAGVDASEIGLIVVGFVSLELEAWMFKYRCLNLPLVLLKSPNS